METGSLCLDLMAAIVSASGTSNNSIALVLLVLSGCCRRRPRELMDALGVLFSPKFSKLMDGVLYGSQLALTVASENWGGLNFA